MAAKPGAAISKVRFNEAQPMSVMLFTGKEQAFADRGYALVRDVLRQRHPDLETHELDASQAVPGELVTLASPSLFGEARLLKVTGANSPSAAFMEDLTTVLSILDDNTTITLRHAGGNGGRALLKLVRDLEFAVEVDCEPVKDSDKPALVVGQFRRHGVRIEQEAVRALTQAYATDVAELLTVCDQLARDTATGSVTVRQVEQLTAGRIETTSFKIADAATAGNAQAALTLLRHGLETGLDPIALAAAITMKLRLMAKVWGVRDSSRNLAKELGAQPWQIERAMRDARPYEQRELARLIDFAAHTEWLLKGGARNREFAIERFVLAVARRKVTS